MEARFQDMTVSLLINSDSLASDVIEQYRQMVAYSVGIQPEKVFIANAAFLPQIRRTGIHRFGGRFFPAVAGSAPVCGRRPCRAGACPSCASSPKAQKARRPFRPNRTKSSRRRRRKRRPIPDEIVLNETREQNLKRQVKEFASSNPEIVAQLLRAWMKEDPK